MVSVSLGKSGSIASPRLGIGVTDSLDLLLEVGVCLLRLGGFAAGLFGIELKCVASQYCASRSDTADSVLMWKDGLHTLAWNSVCISRASCRCDMVAVERGAYRVGRIRCECCPSEG